MKKLILLIQITFCATLYAQTKKDTLTLTTFTVDKNGKAIVKYNYLDGATVQYKIEGKDNLNKWIVLSESGVASVVKHYSGYSFTQKDSFNLNLDKIKEIRIQFIKPQTAKVNNKTVIP